MKRQLDPAISPLHSVSICPVCEAGLCGIRICTGDDPMEPSPHSGFVLCDECEAAWLDPNTQSPPVYLDPERPLCPICRGGLWGTSRWADRNEVETLGWTASINPDLDAPQ